MMSSEKKNLFYRILVAVVFIPALVYCFYSGGYFMLFGVLAIVFALASEFTTIPSISTNPLQEILLVAGAMVLVVFRYANLPIDAFSFVILFSAAWFLLELLRRPMEGSLRRAMVGPFVLIFFALIPSLAFDLKSIHGLYAILPLMTVWMGDTMAYAFGKSIGGPKMTPVLSPNKTWAGFSGEIIGTTAVGVAFKLIWPQVFGWEILIFSIPAGIFAVLGDLFESKVKREMSIKDSSDAIPGHGGFWDRFDSWLFVQFWAWVVWTIL